MAMDRALEEACLRVGWDALYERYIPDLRPANSRGEREARSPFPFSDDDTPSFRVNVYNGLWIDWHASQRMGGLRGGNFVQFLAFMSPTGYEADGTPIADFAGTERRLREALGLSRPVDPEWLRSCQAVFQDPAAREHRAWSPWKPWHPGVLTALGVGWDEERRRVVIPCHERGGQVANCRMYMPGAPRDVPKIMWLNGAAGGGNFLLPHCAWDERWSVLVEGEADMLTLRSLGYNAVCGTEGSGNPVPPGWWWRGRQVIVLMDADAAGEAAARAACEIMRAEAAALWVARLPEWEGRPHNADVSDYVMHLYRGGAAVGDVQRAVTEVFRAAEQVDLPHGVYDSEPVDVPFAAVLTAANSGRRLRWTARVVASSAQKYKLPTVVAMTCPAGGHTYCRQCPMSTRSRGAMRLQLDPRSPLSLKLIQTDDERQQRTLLGEARVPAQCPDVRLDVVQSVDVEAVMLGQSAPGSEETVGDGAPDRRLEALALLRGGERLADNADHTFEGFVYPMPRSQKLVLLADTARRLAGRADGFAMTDEAMARLSAFAPAPGETALQALRRRAADLASSVTLIRGREDLHLAYLAMWHSLLAFQFGGATVRRGWIEFMVVGDTRCGKSATFRRLAEWLGLGLLVDCKMHTTAGLLGSVETSTATGERFVVAGLLPRNDGGVVCFDEFAMGRWEKVRIMDQLSSTRAEGVARITKAADASFMARVRAAWLANPGQGRLMRDIGVNGVELLTRLIDQPEDIARFDFAMAVSQDDVPPEQVNSAAPPTEPAATREASRELLAWAHSRRPEQVVWAPGAERMVLALAEAMYNRYDASIPLVEPADQRMRCAKLAVSVAAQLFSVGPDGESLTVRPEHVEAAAHLFAAWYDKPAFGYDAYSRRAVGERSIVDPAGVEALLDQTFGPHAIGLAEKLLRLRYFNERMFATLVPVQWMAVHSTLQALSANRCIDVSGRSTRDAYEITPQFASFLRAYLERRKP